MATSEKKKTSSSPSSTPSVSFAELPKLMASHSYLAAALKASVAMSTSPSSSEVFSRSDSSIKREGAYSPPTSPSAVLTSKGSDISFHPHSFLSTSLGEAAVASLTSSLLKNSAMEANATTLSSMLQGIPLLSSVLPALQRLAPVSLSSLSQACGSGGIICVCGVKFNSTSNLEAHRMFYCSHRPASSDSRSVRKDDNRSPSRDREEEGSSPNGRLLKCPHCAYTTSHKLSLNGHMNIHTSPEEKTLAASSNFSQPIDPKAQERYCSDCDIQFSSMKTFRVHKLHYCQTRHVLKGAKSPVREEPPHMSIAGLGSGANNTQPILALPTNPILLLPYSLVAGAQLLPPQFLPHIGAAFVLPNGQVHPIPSAPTQHSPGNTSIPPLLSPSAVAAAAAALAGNSSTVSSVNVSPTVKTEPTSYRSKSPKEEETSGKRRGEGDGPLDLTTTKRPKLAVKTDLLSDEEKENRELNNCLSSKSPVSKSLYSGGEFEGKLLSSPPRASPTRDDELLIGKTSRPASAAPSLSSPREPPTAESPRPSTSAVPASSRSPGHASPITSAVTTGLPPLPPGFPKHLVSSLETLGSTLPLASLQCLQSLQGVPRELALKLMNSDLLMNGLPPVLNPPVIVKQGEAKCNECNIVFYKEESLQIHKKHYCSAREITKPTTDEERRIASDRSPSSNAQESSRSPIQSPVRETPSTTSQPVAKDSPKQTKPLLQFICTACGIKFSSPDNLAAHQTYYCPKRDDIGDEGGSGKGIWRCPRCRIVMTETMQAAHQCVSPTPAPSHGWKCPCCPVLSPTAAAAQKHLETHAGIKAFRCTICGYRGNTLRGMRTHIRMHFEKRTNDLQEENFIACILEDDECRMGRNSTNNDSRKILESARLLYENSALSSFLGEVSEQADPPYTCSYCPFITSLQTTLLQHLTVVHNVAIESKIAQELKSFLESQTSTEDIETKREKKDSENGTAEDSPPVSSIKLEPEVKLEVHDTDDELPRSTDEEPKSPAVSVSATALSNGSPPIVNGQCFCHTCNISFSLLDSYVAHKKYYCSRPEANTPPETTVQ